MSKLTRKEAQFAVIFESVRSGLDDDGYAQMAAHMNNIAHEQDGFCGIETYRNGKRGVTISWWRDREAITAWGRHPGHRKAKELGRTRWYDSFHLEIVRIDENRTFKRSEPEDS